MLSVQEAKQRNSGTVKPIAMPETRRPDREDELAGAKESEWFSKLVSLQAETVSACLSALSSPLFSRRPFGSERDRTVEPGMLAAANDTSEIGGGGGGSGGLVRKIGVGILAAAYVGMILTILLVVAAVMGVAVVRMWVEEPVLLRERLNFDYTDAHPKAIFSFVQGSNHGGEYNSKFVGKSKKMGVPVGHTFYVSLLLVMPESDYNRELGIFQVINLYIYSFVNTIFTST